MARTPTRYGLGWIPDLPDQRDHLYAAPPPMLSKLPPQYDLRDHFQLPAVYDQGQIGSCTANAIAGALEFDRLKQNLEDFVPSRLFIYYNERDMEGTVNSDSGAYIRDGIKSVATQGDCPEDLWPYDGSPFPPNPLLAEKPTPNCYASAQKYTAVSYQRISPLLNQMKGCLYAGAPFVFGVSVYDSFMASDSGNIPLPDTQTESLLGGHAILAVGYDDARRVFVFRNSWGTAWGQGGYGTIPYAYLLDTNLSDDFWTITVVQ
jgi:C1A family cysteine protease